MGWGEEGEKEKGRKGGQGSSILWQTPGSSKGTRTRGEKPLLRWWLSHPQPSFRSQCWKLAQDEQEEEPWGSKQKPEAKAFFPRKSPLCCSQGATLQTVLFLIEKQSVPLTLAAVWPAGWQSHTSGPQVPISLCLPPTAPPRPWFFWHVLRQVIAHLLEPSGLYIPQVFDGSFEFSHLIPEKLQHMGLLRGQHITLLAHLIVRQQGHHTSLEDPWSGGTAPGVTVKIALFPAWAKSISVYFVNHSFTSSLVRLVKRSTLTPQLLADLMQSVLYSSDGLRPKTTITTLFLPKNIWLCFQVLRCLSACCSSCWPQRRQKGTCMGPHISEAPLSGSISVKPFLAVLVKETFLLCLDLDISFRHILQCTNCPLVLASLLKRLPFFQCSKVLYF